jgi:hypothetical protein
MSYQATFNFDLCLTNLHYFEGAFIDQEITNQVLVDHSYHYYSVILTVIVVVAIVILQVSLLVLIHLVLILLLTFWLLRAVLEINLLITSNPQSL